MSHFPRRNLPSYNVLRSFEAAARYESFTRAAQELNLTQGAISRQVKEVEQAVGVELFQRVGRRVVLTAPGRNLASDLAVDLENIRLTMLRAISAGGAGTALRVACLPTFASRWLIPRLPAFAGAHPEIEINLSTRHEPFDLSAAQFDMAVHFGKPNWPDADMQFLCSESLVAVGAPHLIENHQSAGLEGLSDLPLLHLYTRPTAWSDFFERFGVDKPDVLRGKYFDQFSMIIAGAIAGLGAGLVPTYLIEHELETGQLVQLNPEPMSTDNSYYLVTPAGVANANVDTLCRWMQGSVNRV